MKRIWCCNINDTVEILICHQSDNIHHFELNYFIGGIHRIFFRLLFLRSQPTATIWMPSSADNQALIILLLYLLLFYGISCLFIFPYTIQNVVGMGKTLTSFSLSVSDYPAFWVTFSGGKSETMHKVFLNI